MLHLLQPSKHNNLVTTTTNVGEVRLVGAVETEDVGVTLHVVVVSLRKLTPQAGTKEKLQMEIAQHAKSVGVLDTLL